MIQLCCSGWRLLEFCEVNVSFELLYTYTVNLNMFIESYHYSYSMSTLPNSPTSAFSLGRPRQPLSQVQLSRVEQLQGFMDICKLSTSQVQIHVVVHCLARKAPSTRFKLDQTSSISHHIKPAVGS